MKLDGDIAAAAGRGQSPLPSSSGSVEARSPAAQVAAMFAPRCGARVILLAHDERVVRRRLDTYAERARSIALVPLGQRTHEVTRLLQAIWRDELGTTRAR